MTQKYKNTDEHKKEVYFYLGLLSTLFAKMESKLLDILGKHLTSDFVLANTLFERNTLYQNIEMLKSVSDLKSFEEETVIPNKNIKKTNFANWFFYVIFGLYYNSDYGTC